MARVVGLKYSISEEVTFDLRPELVPRGWLPGPPLSLQVRIRVRPGESLRLRVRCKAVGLPEEFYQGFACPFDRQFLRFSR